jgi:hypothetical protein
MLSFSPSSQIVGPEDSFSVDIYCVPGQPIKAFELVISFDSSLVNAISVSEGDIFNGFDTFFNSGTIDNQVGKIVDIYGLIIGSGNVSEPGTLIEIDFASKSTTDISSLSFISVGVTNETEYVQISLTNGYVQVDANSPTISDVSAIPAFQVNSGFVNISAVVTDNIEVDEVSIKLTYPDDSFESILITSNKIKNIYYCNKTYDMSGAYSYYILAKDSVENIVMSADYTFTIGDITLPEISNVLFTSTSPLDTDPDFCVINITCDVTDDIGVKEVYLYVSYKGGSWNNLLFNSNDEKSYYYSSNTTFSEAGNYSYYIQAVDVSNNTVETNNYNVYIPANWDINKDCTINIFDLILVSNRFNETGDKGWIREDVDNNGEVQLFDLNLVSDHYGENYWNN